MPGLLFIPVSFRACNAFNLISSRRLKGRFFAGETPLLPASPTLRNPLDFLLVSSDKKFGRGRTVPETLLMLDFFRLGFFRRSLRKLGRGRWTPVGVAVTKAVAFSLLVLACGEGASTFAVFFLDSDKFPW